MQCAVDSDRNSTSHRLANKFNLYSGAARDIEPCMVRRLQSNKAALLYDQVKREASLFVPLLSALQTLSAHPICHSETSTV